MKPDAEPYTGPDTVAGGGTKPPAEGLPALEASFAFDEESDLEVDPAHNLLLVSGQTLWRIDPSRRVLSHVDAGGEVSEVEVDGGGNLHVLDRTSGEVRRISNLSGEASVVLSESVPAGESDAGNLDLGSALSHRRRPNADPRVL